MSGLLFDTRRELTNGEAGGHGDRWSVFADDVSAFINQWLGKAIAESEVPSIGVTDTTGLDTFASYDEPDGCSLLYTGLPKGESLNGLMGVIHQVPGSSDREPSSQLYSAFPFFGEGVEIEAMVEQVCLFPNRLEARLELSLAIGGLIEPFDSLFWLHRAMYRKGEVYRFSIAALAYQIGRAHV